MSIDEVTISDNYFAGETVITSFTVNNDSDHDITPDKGMTAYFTAYYEDADYHNAVFVGKNSEGVPVHAQKRATSAKSDFKGNVDNSIAEYSFHFTGTSEYLFVFEAPIDMLAYITMHKQGWENHSYVALCSTSDRATLQMLKDNPDIKTVYLCLDNDSAGLLGCERIADSIHALGDYTIWRVPPQNKDWDEDLKALNGREAIPAEQKSTFETNNIELTM